MTLLESKSCRSRWMACAAVAYLIFAGAVLWWWLGQSGVETSLAITMVCFAPAILGGVLAGTSTADQNQYMLRVIACLFFMPVLLLFWGTSLDPHVAMPERQVWPFATVAGIGHAVACVGFIFLGGSMITKVPAAPGVAACGAEVLHARLLSLNQSRVTFAMSSNSADTVLAALRFPEGEDRGHIVVLNFDVARQRVRVREKVWAEAARPKTEEEASMRGPGDNYFDPARPNAMLISGNTAQTSTIDPQRLAAVPLRLLQNTVELPTDFAAWLDADGMITVLCAVVTQSGWRWQPVFLGAGK